MAFSTPGNGRPKAEINVTPMIDVLLVLLIIFMVILPSSSIGLKARVAQSSSGSGSAESDAILITVNGAGAIHLNEEAVAAKDVPGRLAELFVTSRNAPVFVRADPDLTFEPVAQVIDLARGAGFERVGLMKK